MAVAAANGDQAAVELVRDGGRRLGLLLAGLVSFFNPGMVVLGGGVAAGLGHPLLAELRSVVYRRSLPLATGNLPIVLSELGAQAGVIGAARMASDSVLPMTDVETARPMLTMAGIVKEFPGVRALDGVDLDVVPGEVHCLLGQNGAGKSTLIKVLAGAHQPDEGTITWQGEQVRLPTPMAAMRLGIATIYQELDLVDGLSVAENIFLGHEQTRRRLHPSRPGERRGPSPARPARARRDPGRPARWAGSPPRASRS